MSLLWSLERGAQPQPDRSVRFSVWAPRAKHPRVRICTGPAHGDHPLATGASHPGVWSVAVPNVGAGDDYVFVLDDGRPLPDPVSRWQPHGVHGASRVVDPTSFVWSDANWRGVSMPELAIYELHVGTFTSDGTFAAAAERLPALKALGVSAVELMPVAQFPGGRNWGYDGVNLYAVQTTYGGPHELKSFVAAAHATGLGVILDVVYNHVGPEGNYLDAFGPYFTDKYKTPWGRALNYDDADSDEVRRFIVDNARYWVTEYHVDGLRLDAVHGIFDFSARHLLEEIADAVHTQGALLGKSLIVIGESDLNDPKLVRPVDEHGFGLDAQWSDDFHHAMHAVLTGERSGYYADFGSVATIAEALREPFVYDGRYSVHRRRKHGAPSVGIPRQRFVVAVQNHDQVGNRAAGDRLAAMLTPAQLRLAAALLILSPYVPLVFMGEEYGETNPFQYFISHGDEQLVLAVRDGRRKEFESFGWGEHIPDPQSERTFERSKIDWSKATRGEHAHQLALYRDLLALRRDEPMLRPDGARLSVASGEPGWITLLREPVDDSERFESDGGGDLLCVFNCSSSPADVPVPGSDDRAWILRLSTDATAFGGQDRIDAQIPVRDAARDEPRRLLGGAGSRTVRLPEWSAALYRSLIQIH